MTDEPDEPNGTIVGDPAPDEQGMVSFEVQVGNEIVIGVANPCGAGLREDFAAVNSDVASAVMRVVSQFVQEHRDEMPGLYREAARLRRAAGNAPFFGNLRRGRFEVVGAPVKLGDVAARFTHSSGGDAAHRRDLQGWRLRRHRAVRRPRERLQRGPK
jgi:hypothetical protein